MMMRARIVIAAVTVLAVAAGAVAQRRAFDPTIANGKKLVTIRAAITVEALKKALAAK
jgi:hypothetical protein